MGTIFKGIVVSGLTAAALLDGAGGASAQQRVGHAIGSATSPPWIWTTDGPAQGLMVDLCTAIAQDNGWSIDFSGMTFADLLPTLAAGRADMICSAFSYTADRAAEVAFTPPFYEAGEGMVVLASDTTPYRSWTEVKDQPVSSARGTTYLQAMQDAGIFTDLHIYDTTPLALDAVAAGEVKAYFVLLPSLAYAVRQGYPTLRVVDTYEPVLHFTYNIAVRKDDPALLAAVDASLAKLAADGTIREILSGWGL
jgi:polar amino acid transport system substrate-binding protein